MSWPEHAIYVRCGRELVEALDQARNRLADAEQHSVSRGEMARRLLEAVLTPKNGKTPR